LIFLFEGFKWTDLPDGSIIVDLGGGVGSTALIIAKAIPHVNLVVQDRPSVIEDAKTVSFICHGHPNAATSS
jgi:tRNA1(Val) A37 N6-methylase TrmN6